MDRCHKMILSLLVIISIFVSTNLVEAYAIPLNEGIGTIPRETSTNKKRKQVINITNEDFMLLSRLVTGEARGESYEGQLAVAAVVINRVKDPRFPNSIEGVIYQKNAFSVVNDGAINMEPVESAYKAVEEALYGLDPTEQSVFFWNPDIATCQWIKTLSPHKRIGNHVFAK